jgi:Alkaline phosphatase
LRARCGFCDDGDGHAGPRGRCGRRWRVQGRPRQAIRDHRVTAPDHGQRGAGRGARRDAARRPGGTGSTRPRRSPAAPSSHISRRGCQRPADARSLCPTETKAAGGLGSIVEQQVDHRLDVNLGGGRARYEQTLDGSSMTVVDYALSKGFQYVTDVAGLGSVRSVRDEPVLGLFAPINMTTQFRAAHRRAHTGRRVTDHALRRGLPARFTAQPRRHDREGDRAARR